MTFSVAAYDPEDKLFGVAVASRFLSVGSVVPWAKTEVGAIATQAYSNYTYGPEGLKLLSKHTAKETIQILTDKDPLRDRRQIGIVDSSGNAFAYTGKDCINYAGSIVGENYTVQGNILAGEEVLKRMSKEMEKSNSFADRLINALKAAESVGGDRRGKQSAAVLVVGLKNEFEQGSAKVLDIRVDDHDEPVNELERISRIWFALFGPDEPVEVEPHQEEITSALQELGYGSLRNWADANNFVGDSFDTKIGHYKLQVLLDQASKK